METDFHYPSDFCLFLVTFSNDIFWNSQISIKWLVSTFRCWQFSRSSFFCTKNITKKVILEFQLSAPHLVGFGPQKEFPFDPCQYRGFLFLYKAYPKRTVVVVCEKPWFAPCYRTFHFLKMWKKFYFLELKSLYSKTGIWLWSG